MTEIDLASVRRVLLVRPSALGDVCRSVPVAATLKRAMPGAQLDWLVQRGFEEAVSAHPDVDRVIPFPRKEIGLGRLLRSGASRRLLRELLGDLRPARGERYDLVVDCQGLLRSGLLARWTGARLRIGESRAREGAARFYTHRVETGGIEHTVDRMLAIVGGLGIEPIADMRLYVEASWRERAAEKLGSAAADGPLVVVAPTSRWAGKRWPAERFAAVIEGLLSERAGGAPAVGAVAIVASAGEREQCAAVVERFAGEPRVIDLVGRTGVGELLAVIERSSLVVANDSAALHMAVGFGRAIVALFGPTRVDRVGPYGRAGDVLQPEAPVAGTSHKDAAAGSAMMSRIGVDEVLSAAVARLRAAAGGLGENGAGVCNDAAGAAVSPGPERTPKG